MERSLKLLSFRLEYFHLFDCLLLYPYLHYLLLHVVMQNNLQLTLFQHWKMKLAHFLFGLQYQQFRYSPQQNLTFRWHLNFLRIEYLLHQLLFLLRHLLFLVYHHRRFANLQEHHLEILFHLE